MPEITNYELRGAGFDQILIHAKWNYVFTIGNVKQSLREHKQDIELQDDQWGCGDTPVARCSAESPTFGHLILLLYASRGFHPPPEGTDKGTDGVWSYVASSGDSFYLEATSWD